MSHKSTRVIRDSQSSSVKVSPRKERFYTLTPLGHKAVAWLKEHDPTDEEFAFFCPGCLRPLSKCSCPISER